MEVCLFFFILLSTIVIVLSSPPSFLNFFLCLYFVFLCVRPFILYFICFLLITSSFPKFINFNTFVHNKYGFILIRE